MNKDYQLPSQKDEAKRSRNEVEIEYGLFSMNDQLEELGKNKIVIANRRNMKIAFFNSGGRFSGSMGLIAVPFDP